jgi:hypothetical protein
MTDADLWAAWRLWMGVAVVIVLVAASLLIAIWRTAVGVLAEAVRARNAAERIRKNTLPIWQLQTSNHVAGELLTTVRAIEAKGGALTEALQHTAQHSGDR